MLDPRGHALPGESAQKKGVSASLGGEEGEGEGEGESTFLSPGDYIFWDWKRPEAFSKLPINFPSFRRLLIGPHPPVRMTGLYAQAPPPVTLNNPILKGGGQRSVNPLGRAML